MRFSFRTNKSPPRYQPNRRKARVAILVLTIIASAALFNLANAASLPILPLGLRIQGWVNTLANPQLTAERHTAQQHLEEAGEASVIPLLDALKSDNVVLRRNSAEMLSYISSARSGEMLLNALNSDPDATVRVNAAWALSEQGSIGYAKDLKAVSILDPDPNVRVAAHQALQNIGSNLAYKAKLNVQDDMDAFASADSDTAYVASQRDLFVSRDGGSTWQVLQNVLPGLVLALEVDPKDSALLYAGVDGLGIYKSADGGLTWSAVNTGLNVKPGAHIGITAIAIDETNSQRVVAAEGSWVGANSDHFYPLGILESLDGGATWRLKTQTANSRPIDRMILKGDELYALAGDSDVLMMSVY
jgi:hypothetical protein